MKKVMVVCLALSFVLSMTTVAFAGDEPATTVNGWVSDSQCGVKGANDKSAECTKKCVAKGAKLVIVTDGDQKVLAVDNQDALTGHEGHHVSVSGHVTGDSIHVMGVKMM